MRSPRDALAHEGDRLLGPSARGVDAEVAQEHERIHVRPPERGAATIAPLAVGTLLIEQPRAPALRRDARPFRSHSASRSTRQIAHHLPANRRVALQEPADYGIARSCSAAFVI